MTKLPDHLRQAPQRRLRDLAIGETGRILSADMEVDAEGYCFLDPAAKIIDVHASAIRVERREDGYHITVWSKSKWNSRDFERIGWYPVASISEAEDWLQV